MLLQSCNSFSCPFNNVDPPKAPFLIQKNSRIPSYFPFRCVSNLACPTIALSDVAGIFQNKVLIAAAVSAAIGQLSKPITSTILYGKNYDFKAVVHAGGFPSTHSSVIFSTVLLMHEIAVVATATSLGLERGFSDVIFGLAVVYAGLVMYDAQGVRREVGIHAKELNKVLLSTRTSSTSSSNDASTFTNSFPGDLSSDLESTDPLLLEEQRSFQTKQANASLLLKSENRIKSTTIRSSGVASDVGEESVGVSYGYPTLKESVGHTEIEVIAGAMLGFVVSLAICRYG
ncbi:uncharacterized protein LOC111382255 isoform X1 [Olea europaea var. sylvestris]|uniref:uncharacterized protein LOC111382255 isoform X1 n=1 Tax=Olea europaea var. sylvestris TaxID=158386 RepID=UPI000C1D7923|nr:uncharacterized protein LOC111382255 isoform X1 [Olea europaea var. sylvestris]